ncbi:hypothetical protein B0T20DRAFT_477206 [Sordaria brevicollis]|uniref:F-box domain-containing protein n=1 Tax=Sordaria brevicollis TaxID=83679 RepID=A0AAE0PJM0_SORBR|nr:hypothetical protein B0T20DRAFT_477206 [Sordaria brevicollis]
MKPSVGSDHQNVSGEPSSGTCEEFVPSIFGNPYKINRYVAPFLFLRLPPELRIIVYRELWTLPVGRDLTSGIKSLAQTCRQMRKEVLDEYIKHILPRTQIHLSENRMVLETLTSARFLTRHLQHVSLLIGHCFCRDDPTGNWFSNYSKGCTLLVDEINVPNLKTVELVFTDEHYRALRSLTKDATSTPLTPLEADLDNPDDLEEWHPEAIHPWFCPDCWEMLLELPHTVEKVVFKVCPSATGEKAEGITGPVAVSETWDVTEWWHQMRYLNNRFLHELMEPLPPKLEPKTYQIEYHVGDVNVEWPLDNEI